VDFLKSFEELSSIGATAEGGVDRQAASEEDGLAREWLRARLIEYGATITVDSVGNLFGLFLWTDDAPFILTGSHLDSQPSGGRFDGAYGVLASLAAAQRLNFEVQSGVSAPRYNLAVVDWTNEEGARFQPSVMGSSVFVGSLPLGEALASRDTSGDTLQKALQRIGFLGPEAGAKATISITDVVAYAEIHVEQGNRLETTGANIGVVTGSWAAYKYDLRLTGEQSHTGATPMADRRDALLAAATVILGVNALTHGIPDFHTSVTELDAGPKSPNVVACLASMHVELRAPTLAVLEGAEVQLLQLMASVESELAVAVSITRQWHRAPAIYWPAGVVLAKDCADRAGLSCQFLETISGHDSIALNSVVPTVMLFTPSSGGWAHNSKELTLDPDLNNGVDMLTEVLRALCVGVVET
jgi:N-carbamoyl-L-amino-acid hydrolase